MALWHENQGGKHGAATGWRRHIKSAAATALVVLLAGGAFGITNALRKSSEPTVAVVPSSTPTGSPTPTLTPGGERSVRPALVATVRGRAANAQAANGGTTQRLVIFRTTPTRSASPATPVVRRTTPQPRASTPRVAKPTTPGAPNPGTPARGTPPPAVQVPAVGGSTPSPPVTAPSTPLVANPEPDEHHVDEHDGHHGHDGHGRRNDGKDDRGDQHGGGCDRR